MAIRTKTIEYAFPTVTTNLAAATRRDLSAITLYIPETTSRTFLSVQLVVDVADAATVAASMTSWLMGIRLGAAAFSDVTTTYTITNTGDPLSFVFTRDVTSYFTTNFGAGASQTCQAGVQFAGVITANTSAKLIITYSYDDAAATTRVKTVRLPLESLTTTLTDALASIGSNQIPDLDLLLPEASKVYRSIWMDFSGVDAGNALTDFGLRVRLDAAAEQEIWVSEQVLNGSRFVRSYWDLSAMDTTNAHDLQARSTLTTRFPTLVAVLYVTYEYNHSTSTQIMNSLMVPAADEATLVGTTTTSSISRRRQTLWIQEPGTITMVQSGVVLYSAGSASMSPNIAVGVQAFRTYGLTAGSVESSDRPFCHRIDSGGAQGAALTLARGRNDIDVDWYITVPDGGSNVSGFMLVNYTSDKHTDGDGVHNHTTHWCYFVPNTTGSSPQRAITAPDRQVAVPETSYFVSGMLMEIQGVHLVSGTFTWTLVAQVESGEIPNEGWVAITSLLRRSDAEAARWVRYGALDPYYMRFPTDPRSRLLNPETTREYRTHSNSAHTIGGGLWFSYHAITYAVAGNVAGSGGGVVNVSVHDATTHEILGTTSRTGDGAYSFTWYDNTRNVYASAREDGTHVGRSDNGLAS